MDRRELLGNSLGVLAATSAAGVMGASSALAAGKTKSKKRESLTDSALECIRASERCITACLEQNDIDASSINACRDCVAVCETLVRLEATNSRHLRSFAALCAQVCRDCEAACREDSDEACQECARACAACAECCEAYAR